MALLAGSQLEAISAVLVAFFGGLALGARWLGPLADRVASPLRLYAGLEVGAGLLAAASLAGLELLALAPIAGALGLAAAAAGIAPATLLLGGTLPALLAAAARRRPEEAPRLAGWLTGANTAGSVAGALLAALAIPRAGLRATLLGAALGSLAIGALAAAPARAPRSAREGGPGAARAGPGPALLAAAFAAGAATLGFEVLAARLAALRLGSSLYAWSAVLALFLAGLAAGNVAFARAAVRSARPLLALGWVEAAAAAAIALGAAQLATPPTAPAEGLTPAALASVAAGVLPAAVCLGGAFPLLVRLASGRGGVARAFAGVAAANTAGGIAGALLAPFALLPALGPRGGALACAGVAALLAAGFLVAGSPRRAAAGLRAAGAGALALAAAALPPAGPPAASRARVLFVHHGRQATAVVTSLEGRRDLLVDGDPEASTAGEARRTEELLAILPLALHPAPRRFLELGLGSGITLGTAARFPLEAVDCVEIADSVLRAAPWFAPANGAVGAGQGVRIFAGDARVFLPRHPAAYDIAVANTLHPWSVGATGLYSVEYFRRLAGALAAGGIAAQWLPVERIGAESLGAILRTFYAVFPQGGLFWGAENLLAVGSATGLVLPPLEELRRRLAAARPAPGMGELPDAEELRAGFIASAAAARTALGAGELLTDDRPRLEALGARLRSGAGAGPVWGLLVRVAEAGEAEAGPSAAAAWLAARAARVAGDAAGAGPLEARAAALGLARAVAGEQARPLVLEGYRALAAGDLGAAEAAFRGALARDPGARDARFGLAGAALAAGRNDAAIEELHALLERFPEDAGAHNELATALARAGDRRGARRAAERALAANPFYPEALANAGLLALAAGDRPAAEGLLGRLRTASPLGETPEGEALRAALGRAAGAAP